ncbi:Gene Transfer Agent (GTA)-like protein [Shimia abyssi]|uniref:Gene Transfer Agent (GTA)-like protein n=1 Tax=Shimia abyssi TaxID=1662395 RepID=A0A2P8FFV0_9RHOB|nr:Gene Transfer Agent (GTA)-like protein [Shimia abyssi]
MATVVLAAAGAAIGGTLGGGVAGVSALAVGRLAGATVGRVIDQKILGSGSEAVESGKVDRFGISGSAEGSTTARVFGRMRVAGHLIWSSQFTEAVSTTGGGKGAPSQPTVREYSYAVSLAIAVCEGEIRSIGRIWADGTEIALNDLNLRVYTGSPEQMPDPKIEAVEGAGTVPAYRGTAYVVIEDLALERFGNRIPQFSFEVVKGTPDDIRDASSDMANSVRAVALMPGSGEYALATSTVRLPVGPAEYKSVNENSPSGQSDFLTSMEQLQTELPNVGSASLIVSWFGDDLRAAEFDLRPKVEQKLSDGDSMKWEVAGLSRNEAEELAQVQGRAVYGGTPCDASVVEAITHLKETGKDVVFYPFILMEQMEGNGLPDPWSEAANQPKLPWRGRITQSVAHGRVGSPSGTALADQEVAAFFGTASASDFAVQNGLVAYAGPDEWRYRRFILHNAALCASAGGVDAFCIGSEMRGLTQILGVNGFPAVQELRAVAADVRQILGPDTKIGYAADWSEYFGFHPQDGTGDIYFHLDPLWADENIDFIGIDNYMPLSDWRDGKGHLDAQQWPSIYDLGYLSGNIEGGEGYEWYYHSDEAQDAQIRTAISDGDHNEPWVFRYKDIRNWWSNEHHQRIGGVRQKVATDWLPGSKPIWFTEIGCAAVDKGTNQPNKFLDPKSSESSLPHFSNGGRDAFIQQRYLQAMQNYWSLDENNPKSEE